MKRYAHGVAIAALLALGACQSQPAGQAAASLAGTVSEAILPPADLAKVKAGCTTAAPLLNAAVEPGVSAPVSDTALDAQAYCSQLAAAPAGQVPATTDSNTSSWVPAVVTAVEAAAQIAGEVLPLIAAL